MKWLGVGRERTRRTGDGLGTGQLAGRGAWGVVKAQVPFEVRVRDSVRFVLGTVWER